MVKRYYFIFHAIFLVNCSNGIINYEGKSNSSSKHKYAFTKSGEKLKSDLINYIEGVHSKIKAFDLAAVSKSAELLLAEMASTTKDKSAKLKHAMEESFFHSSDNDPLLQYLSGTISTPTSLALINMKERITTKELFFAAILQYTLDEQKLQKEKKGCYLNSSYTQSNRIVNFNNLICENAVSSSSSSKIDRSYSSMSFDRFNKEKYLPLKRRNKSSINPSILQTEPSVSEYSIIGIKNLEKIYSARAKDSAPRKSISTTDINRHCKTTYSYAAKSTSKITKTFVNRPLSPAERKKSNEISSLQGTSHVESFAANCKSNKNSFKKTKHMNHYTPSPEKHLNKADLVKIIKFRK